MVASMPVLGRVFPPAHLAQDPHAQPGHALGFGQSSGRVVPAGGALSELLARPEGGDGPCLMIGDGPSPPPL